MKYLATVLDPRAQAALDPTVGYGIGGVEAVISLGLDIALAGIKQDADGQLVADFHIHAGHGRQLVIDDKVIKSLPSSLVLRRRARPPVVCGLQAEKALPQPGIVGRDHQIAPSPPPRARLFAQRVVAKRRVGMFKL